MFNKYFFFLLTVTILILGWPDNQLFSIHKPEGPKKELVKVTKGKLRIDFDGQYRTYTALLFLKHDSVLCIEIKSGIGTRIHTLYATHKEVLFTNETEKVAYHLEYENLSKNLGFEINFDELLDIFSGFPNHMGSVFQPTTYSNNSENPAQKTYNFFVPINNETKIYYTYNMFANKLKEFNIERNPNLNIVTSHYKWDISFSAEDPKDITLNFIFNQQEVELEFDFKKIYSDTLLPNFVDTLYVNQFLAGY